MRELSWNAGDWLTIEGHQSKPGKGLSYPPGDVQAAEPGTAGGWDVYDSTQEGSFYGFSVVEVRRS